MPQDFFALLGQPRRPWLEPEALQATFHHLAATQHPDKTGDSRGFTQVNAAYAVLGEPATRLRHLLELTAPDLLTQQAPLPPALGDAFMRIATLRRAVDAFVRGQSAGSSPLAQALLAPERFALQRDVEKEIAELAEARARILAAVQEADGAWAERGVGLAPHLLTLQQELTYVDKWSGQLREALFGLQAPG